MRCKLTEFRKSFLTSIEIVGSILLFSCGVPTPSQSELDVTLTANDPSYSFSAAKTYTLPSTVVSIQDSNSTNTITISQSLNDFVINQVATQFNNAGYHRLTDSSGPKPDFFVDVSVMQTTNTEVYYSSWSTYWGSYYAPWYTLGVGYAPVPYGYVVSSTLGSLIVNMTNPNQTNTSTQKIPSVWVAVLNGVVDGSSQSQIESRIQSGLSEAFSQSPYLKSGSL
jgi:hypothetical protein